MNLIIKPRGKKLIKVPSNWKADKQLYYAD